MSSSSPAAGPATPLAIPFTVRDLTPDDLPHCGFSGSPLHVRAVARELEKAAAGTGEYLAVCPPSGRPLAIGGIAYDHPQHPGAGVLHQLSVHEALQSCGLGTLLITTAEERARARGVPRVELGVEDENPRARALYERLGYTAYDRVKDGWEAEDPTGATVWYETMCTLLRKQL